MDARFTISHVDGLYNMPFVDWVPTSSPMKYFGFVMLWFCAVSFSEEIDLNLWENLFFAGASVLGGIQFYSCMDEAAFGHEMQIKLSWCFIDYDLIVYFCFNIIFFKKAGASFRFIFYLHRCNFICTILPNAARFKIGTKSLKHIESNPMRNSMKCVG